MHWSITICGNRISFFDDDDNDNDNNNNNNVADKIIIILPQSPPPQYLHIENYISTSMLDNFQNISN